MKDLFIIPECYIDTCLVESLLNTDGVNHQKGCNVVTGVMDDKYADDFAVGVIDFDKKRPSYLSNFHEIASSEHLILMKHNVRSHYMVLIRPAMDGFVLDCATEKGLDMADYGLPSELKAFTKVSKSIATKNDLRFKRLFHEIVDSVEIKLLKNLLNYFKKKGFLSENDELKRFFVSVV